MAKASSNQASAEANRVRVCVVSPEPLRALGLCGIVGESGMLDPVSVSLEEAMEPSGFALLLLDAAIVPKPLELITRLRRDVPDMPVILVSDPLSLDDVQAVIAAGAKGFLPKSANEREVQMAVEIVLDGSIWAPRKVLARLIEAGGVATIKGRGADTLSARLTRKEREVLELLTQGRANREIASVLQVETTTVKAHLGRMLRKAGVKSRVELTLRELAERETEKEFPNRE